MYRLYEKYTNSICSVNFILDYENPVYGDEETYYDNFDLFGNLMKFRAAPKSSDTRVLDSWHQKASLLSDLDLDNLVLDVSDAYSPHGEFTGMIFVGRAPKFTYGTPSYFEVIGPRSTIAKEIRRVIEERNS